MKIGVMPVMCLLPHRNTELGYFARLTMARGYLLTPEFRGFDYVSMAREVQREAPSIEFVIALGEGEAEGITYLGPMLDDPIETRLSFADLMHPDSLPFPDPFDVAFFLLSGGTTGIPKLIPRTHTDYIHHATQS